MRNSIAECPIDDPSVEAKVAALDALVASLDNGSLQPSPYAPPAPAVSPAQRPRYSGCSPTIRAVAESICAANDHCKISDGEASPNNHQGRATLGVDAAAPEATALNVSPPAQPTKTTASTPTRLHVPANQNLPAWRSLNERRKIAAALDGLEEAQAHAFRLTFSPNKDRKLRADAAAGHDILQAINDAIAASFRRRKLKAPAIVFAIEEQPGDGRLHIHGVVEAVSADRDMIREAFTAAGGGAVYSGHASGNSFWLANDPVKGARRYLRYARKDEARVMRRLGIDRVVFMNDRARKIGQNFYTARRAAGTPQKRAGTIPARRDSESSDATQRPSVAVSEPASRDTDIKFSATLLRTFHERFLTIPHMKIVGRYGRRKLPSKATSSTEPTGPPALSLRTPSQSLLIATMTFDNQ